MAVLDIGLAHFPDTPPTKFTLHFWVFAYSYVDNYFDGFKMTWTNYVGIEVYKDSNKKYHFACSVDGVKFEKKIIDFNMNKWNFLHCAIDYDTHKLYITTEEDSFKIENINGTAPTNTAPRLVFEDSTNEDWGVLFFKHIRLWKDAFQYSSFLSRIEIVKESKYFDNDLLYQFNTTFKVAHYLWEMGEDDKTTYNIFYKTSKKGTNIVPEEIYQDVIENPKLCNKEGQYYDRKTE